MAMISDIKDLPSRKIILTPERVHHEYQ